MPSTEDRIRELVDNNLDIEGRQKGSPLASDFSLRDHGVSSVEIVEFTKVVASEFGISVTTEDCANLNSLGDLVSFINAKAA